jgi:hypothetical protein
VKAYHVLLLLAVITVFSCSQKATVEVENLSGEVLRGSIDGAGYNINSGGVASEEIEIGTKFIFGTDEKTVAVTGEGLCVMPFSQGENVKNEDVIRLVAYNNAGLITVVNNTYYDYYVYIESSSLEWGGGWVYPGQEVTWRGPIGYFYIEFFVGLISIGYDEDYLYACTEITYTFYTTQGGQLSASKKQGDEEKVDISGSFGATPAGAKSGRQQLTSPEKRMYEIIASSKGASKAAE